MTRLDRKKLDSALEHRERDLRRSLRERSHISVEKMADTVDEQVLAAAREASAQILTQDLRSLREVEAARSRMREGTFGICLHCQERISPRRLHAVPWALYCISCQAELEEGQTLQTRVSQAA